MSFVPFPAAMLLAGLVPVVVGGFARPGGWDPGGSLGLTAMGAVALLAAPNLVGSDGPFFLTLSAGLFLSSGSHTWDRIGLAVLGALSLWALARRLSPRLQGEHPWREGVPTLLDLGLLAGCAVAGLAVLR